MYKKTLREKVKYRIEYLKSKQEYLIRHMNHNYWITTPEELYIELKIVSDYAMTIQNLKHEEDSYRKMFREEI